MTSIAERKLRMSGSRHANIAEQMFIADSVHTHKPNQYTTVYLYSDLSYLKVTVKKAVALQSDGLHYKYQTRHHNNVITWEGNNYRMSKKVDNQGLHEITRTMAPASVNEVSEELDIFSTVLLAILVYILTSVVSFCLFSIIDNGAK